MCAGGDERGVLNMAVAQGMCAGTQHRSHMAERTAWY